MDCSHGRHCMDGMPKLYSTGNLKCPRIHAKWFSLNRSHQPFSFTSVYFWFKVPYNRKGERSQQLCGILRIKPREVPQNKVTSRGQTWATTIKFTWHLIIHTDFPPCRVSARRAEDALQERHRAASQPPLPAAAPGIAGNEAMGNRSLLPAPPALQLADNYPVKWPDDRI